MFSGSFNFEKGNVVKPIRVTVEVKNNLILSSMEAKGIKSVTTLPDSMGIDRRSIDDLIRMTASPILKNGEWSNIALKLADFFMCLPEDLFTEEQLLPLEVNRVNAEMIYVEAQALCKQSDFAQICDIAAAAELKAVLQSELEALTEREEKVLMLRFGLEDGCKHTQDKIGIMFGVTGARIRQIENKALRKLRGRGHRDNLYAAGARDEDILCALRGI